MRERERCLEDGTAWFKNLYDGRALQAPQTRHATEQSLLDSEGDEDDETLSPDVDLDEQGSHTRLGVGREPERPENNAESASECQPIDSAMRPKAPLQAAARTVLDRGAGLLRRVADRLHRYGT